VSLSGFFYRSFADLFISKPELVHPPFTKTQRASFAASPTLYSDPRLKPDYIVAHDGAVSEPRNVGKTSRKKRVDRKKHSSMNKENPNAITKAARRDSEAGRRYDHAYALGVLQQTLLATNPSLAETAAASFSNVKRGWSRLKANNVCWDVKKFEGVDPLLYNKMDIFATSRLIHEQSNTIDDDIVSLLDDFRAKAFARHNTDFAHELGNLIECITKAAVSHVRRGVQSCGLMSAVQ
jgi:hypothetical protein